MSRVSDEKLATLEAPYLLGDIGTTVDVLLDLRDARALLREAALRLDRYPVMRERIRQHLEGKDQ